MHTCTKASASDVRHLLGCSCVCNLENSLFYMVLMTLFSNMYAVRFETVVHNATVGVLYRYNQLG